MKVVVAHRPISRHIERQTTRPIAYRGLYTVHMRLIPEQAATDLSEEWNQVMFAHGEEFNVPHDHHFIVMFVEYRVVQDICNRKEK